VTSEKREMAWIVHNWSEHPCDTFRPSERNWKMGIHTLVGAPCVKAPCVKPDRRKMLAADRRRTSAADRRRMSEDYRRRKYADDRRCFRGLCHVRRLRRRRSTRPPPRDPKRLSPTSTFSDARHASSRALEEGHLGGSSREIPSQFVW
jgi:hypothetical protein